MITPFNFSSLPRTPWKNGGGETREIVSVPSPDSDAPFLWRASVATLENELAALQLTVQRLCAELGISPEVPAMSQPGQE